MATLAAGPSSRERHSPEVLLLLGCLSAAEKQTRWWSHEWHGSPSEWDRQWAGSNRQSSGEQARHHGGNTLLCVEHFGPGKLATQQSGERVVVTKRWHLVRR